MSFQQRSDVYEKKKRLEKTIEKQQVENRVLSRILEIVGTLPDDNSIVSYDDLEYKFVVDGELFVYVDGCDEDYVYVSRYCDRCDNFVKSGKLYNPKSVLDGYNLFWYKHLNWHKWQELENYRVILVTGPQRSGTTITSHIIEDNLDYTHIDEEDFGVHDRERFADIIQNGDNIVVHCPGMSRYIHEFANADDIIVVWMIRNVEDIIKSQLRIDWHEDREKDKYFDLEYDLSLPIAAIKYKYWYDYQRDRCHNCCEVWYNDFDTIGKSPLYTYHSYFRESFLPRQWRKQGVIEKLLGWIQ